MEVLAAVLAWVKANELIVVSLGFLLSEIIGAYKPIKANGFLSLAIIKLQEFLKKKGAIDLTPGK
jgi:hypothetical protein